jgi:hypothetical protein
VSNSGPDGAYDFPMLTVGSAADFYLHPAASTGYASPLLPILLVADEHRVFDVTIPALSPPVSLPLIASEIEIVPGFFLTVGQDTLEPAPLTEEPTEVSGVQVAAEHQVPVDLDGVVHAMWYLAPFEAEADPALTSGGFPLRLENQWSLPAGGTYEVRVAGLPTEPEWLLAGNLTVTSSGDWLEGDVMVPLFTTVVLFEPSVE